jgi:hypothetical protein
VNICHIICLVISFLLVTGTASHAQKDSVKAASQNPSPMVDNIRKHERIEQKPYPGLAFEITGLLSKPAQIFVPSRSLKSKRPDLLIHFNGASYVTQYAATKYRSSIIAVTVNIGAGSKVYNDAFLDTTKFPIVVDSIVAQTRQRLGHSLHVRRIILSGFSAGYGAIRRIISTNGNYSAVDAVLLLDGFHTSYIPEGRVLAEGGRIDSTGLTPYIAFAQDAASKNSRKKFLITHSEIFPGTFVSTTEATDFLLGSLSLRRTPVLKWGPLGMQQITSTRKGHFAVWGFAGNTARDHVDHVQALYWFLNELMKL